MSELEIKIENETEQIESFATKKEKSKKAIKITAIIIAIVGAVIIIANLLTNLIIPAYRYNKAVEFYSNGKFDAAAELLIKLDDYKDSTELTYNSAVKLFENKQYVNAGKAFNSIGNYKDSKEYAKKFLIAPLKMYDTMIGKGELLFDESGNLMHQTFDGRPTDFIYNEKNELLQKKVYNAIEEKSDTTAYSYEYNENGYLEKIIINSNVFGKTTYLYNYDANGVMTKETCSKKDNSSTKYFNENGSITKEERLSNGKSTIIEYFYDKNNNMIKQVLSNTNGKNVVDMVAHYYEYDKNGNEIKAILTTADSKKEIIDYTYDNFGRIKKSVSECDGKKNVTRYYYNNEGNLILKFGPDSLSKYGFGIKINRDFQYYYRPNKDNSTFIGQVN